MRTTRGQEDIIRVLVVEDDAEISRRLVSGLQEAAFVADHAASGQDAIEQALSEDFDAIVLDLGLPKLDGLAVLKRLRAAGRMTPVLVLTARGTWVEKVEGLNAGADDYVTKPFHIAEIVARLHALLRRQSGAATQLLKYRDIVLDVSSAKVTRGGETVDLTSFEYRMLMYFMMRTGRLITQADLAAHLYDRDGEKASNTLEVYVSRLRRKLGQDVITTARGLGYRMD